MLRRAAELTVFEETTEGLPPSGLSAGIAGEAGGVGVAELERAERHEMACADRIGLSPLARAEAREAGAVGERGYRADLGG